MRYALVGNNDGPLRLLKALQKSENELPVFVGLQKRPDSVLLKRYQESLGLIPFYTGFDQTLLIKLLATQEPEILINCFCNFKFTGLLKLYTCYNIHPSYLPDYRGRHPMHWALINGAKSHGISMHKMSEEYDAGPIIWQEKVTIEGALSVAALRELLMQKLEQHFPEVLHRIINKDFTYIENTVEKGSYWPPRTPADSKISRWDNTPSIHRLVKTLASESNPAYLIYNKNKKLNITDSKLEQTNSKKVQTPLVLDKKLHKLVIQMPDHYLLHLYFEPEADRRIFNINFGL